MHLRYSSRHSHILAAYYLSLLTCWRLTLLLAFRQPQVLYIAQCKSMCMEACQQHIFNSTHANSEWVTQIRHSPASIFDLCLRISTYPYRNCQESCERTADFYKRSPLNCANLCQSQNAVKSGDSSRSLGCVSGCEFYQKAVVTQPGACPTTLRREETQGTADGSNSRMRFQNPCSHVDECRNEGYLCCEMECVKPDYQSNVPPAVIGVRIMERDGHAFEMTWSQEEIPSLSRKDPSDSSLIFQQPPIYVIQIRTFFGPDFQTHRASEWKTLLYTTHQGATMNDLSVGMWYQFRLASVSSQGSRGFEGSLSPPVKLSAPPSAPSPPVNVSSQLWRLLPHRKANVHLVWKAPLHLNIPVENYEIIWRQDHGILQSDGRPINSLFYNKEVIPGTRQSYWIENLVVGVRYKVEVSAICQWGDKTYKSPPNTIFISAPYENPPMKLDPNKINTPTEQCDCRTSTSSPELSKSQSSDSLLVDKIFYSSSGLLQAQIKFTNKQSQYNDYILHWSPRVCIETSESDESWTSHNPKVDTPFVVPSTMLGGRMEFSTNGIKSNYSSAQDILLLSSLHFNCRYELLLCPKRSATVFDSFPRRNRCVKQCFCTPSCQTVSLEDADVPPAKCFQRNNLSILRAPLQLSYNVINYRKDMVNSLPLSGVDVRIQWKHPTGTEALQLSRTRGGEPTSGIRTRIQWGPALQEPVDARLYATYTSSRGSSPLVIEEVATDKKTNSSRTSSSLSVPLRSTRLVVSSIEDSYHKSSENTQREQVVYFTPQWDLQKLEVKVIPENVSSLTLHNLSPNRLYIVSVQGLLVSQNEQQYVGPKSHLYIHLTSQADASKGAQYSAQKSNGVTHASSNPCFILVILMTMVIMLRIWT